MKWLFIVLGILAGLIGLMALIGVLLPKGHVASRRAIFRQTPETIWRALIDIEASPSWRSDLSKVEVIEPGEEGPIKWRETGKQGTILMERLEAEPPRRLVGGIADVDQAFGGRWIYLLEPAEGGTVLTITEEGEVYNPIFRFMSRFVFGHTATLEQYLKDLGKKFGEDVEPTEPR